MTDWTTADIPAQQGRLAVITGATGGLGFETALALAGAGAEVVLAGRNGSKGAEALRRLAAAHPGAASRFELLDLASLESVAAFAERLLAAGRSIGLLVNNAGVMGLPDRQLTVDGFERQFATNYLGHFALTARLLPLLRGAAGTRVVTLSSLAARRAALDFNNLQSERTYGPMRAYAVSKLETLIFALELQRRSAAGGWGFASIPAHPGWARTDIVSNGPAAAGATAALWGLAQPLVRVVSQSAAQGALPVLFAATAPEARGGAYYGPAGWYELKGPPHPARVPAAALDAAAASRLWDISEHLAGVGFA